MKTPRYGIYVPDEVIARSMIDDKILFGIEAAKAMSIDNFGEILDHTIDICVLKALGIETDAGNMNNARSIIENVKPIIEMAKHDGLI